MKLKEIIKNRKQVMYNDLKHAEDLDIHLRELLRKAKEKTGKIIPVGGRKLFKLGLNSIKDDLYLYYDDKDKSTKIVKKKI